jgi:hypothetical protein
VQEIERLERRLLKESTLRKRAEEELAAREPGRMEAERDGTLHSQEQE